MHTKIVKQLIVATMLVAATSCYAGTKWKFGSSNADAGVNIKLEYNEISIESVNDSTVRVHARFMRNDPSTVKWYLKDNVEIVEDVVDLDCTKSRYKVIHEETTISSGDRISRPLKMPLFDEAPEDSMWDILRVKACKYAGKL